MWILIVLMIVPDRFDYTVLTTDDAPMSGGAVSRLLWLSLLIFGGATILSRGAQAWTLLRRLNPFLLIFVLLAVASVTWSIEPAVTARRMIRVVTIAVVAIAFVLVDWHAQRFQNVLRPLITIFLLGSIVFGLGWPLLATHQEPGGPLDGAWRGLATHKNGLGGIACLGLILWFHAWLSKETSALPALAGGAMAVACLLLSRSSTSLVVAIFIILLLLLLLRSPPALRRYLPWMIALLVTALVTYALVLLQILPGLHTLLSPISAMTGKDMTFTGRTDIWDIMSEHIRGQPLLGSGYGAYWTGAVPGSPSYAFILNLDFYPASAHNGYLEVLNDLGTVGLLVLIGYLANFVSQSLRLLRSDRIQASLYLALFLQQAIINLAESRWFSAFSVDFVIMTLATAALARSLLASSGSGVVAASNYRMGPALGALR